MVGTIIRDYGEHVKAASTGYKIAEGIGAVALVGGAGYLAYRYGKYNGSKEHKNVVDAAADEALKKFGL